MPLRAFSIEDGNLGTKSVSVARSRAYSDIDLTFAKKANNDVFKKNDAAAVKQSVKNILMTNFTEKPFVPGYGGNLSALLFALDTDIEEDDIIQQVVTAIEAYEPRADVLSVKVRELPEQHDLRITVTFRILSTNVIESVDLNLTRLR